MPRLRISSELLTAERLPRICVITGERENVRFHRFDLVNEREVSQALAGARMETHLAHRVAGGFGAMAASASAVAGASEISVLLPVSEMVDVKKHGSGLSPVSVVAFGVFAIGTLVVMGVLNLSPSSQADSRWLAIVAGVVAAVALGVAIFWQLPRVATEWPRLLADYGTELELEIPNDRACVALQECARKWEAEQPEGRLLAAVALGPRVAPRADPTKAADLRARAESLAAEGQLDGAVYEMEKAVRADPADAALAARCRELSHKRDVENHRHWGERHAAAGKKAEAIEAFERVLRLEPGDVAALTRIEELKTR